MADSDGIKADLESFQAIAKRLGLKGKEATDYVHEHMIKLGYKAETSVRYLPGKDAGGGSGSGWFKGFGGSSSDDD